MAPSSEELVLAWSSLAYQTADTGWQAISLASTGPIEIQAGLRLPQKEEAILFHFPDTIRLIDSRLPKCLGFIVESIRDLTTNAAVLAITRHSEGNIEMFTTMVCDLIETLDIHAKKCPEEGLLKLLIRRIQTWQNFMSRTVGPMSAENELGLAGELSFLTTLINQSFSSLDALTAWVGPEDAPQDFLFGSGAVEVKATLSSSGFPVKIGNLEQLDDGVVSPLYLAAFKFKISEDGLTLNEMVDKIEENFSHDTILISLFRDRLMLSGYLKIQERYYVRRFKEIDNCIFIVTDNFPRLTNGSVPIGITRATYEINLVHAKDFIIGVDEVMHKLGVKG